MDRAGKRTPPLTPDELAVVFEAVADGKGKDDARHRLAGRNRITICRAFNVVSEFERRGISAVDDAIGEEIAETARYSTTLPYVSNLFLRWKTWKAAQSENQVSSQGISSNHQQYEDSSAWALQQEESGHWQLLRDTAGRLRQQVRAPLLQLLGLTASNPAFDRQYQINEENPHMNQALYLEGEVENFRVSLREEGKLLYSALTSHLPDDPTWSLFETWKGAVKSAVVSFNVLCNLIVSEFNLENSDARLLDGWETYINFVKAAVADACWMKLKGHSFWNGYGEEITKGGTRCYVKWGPTGAYTFTLCMSGVSGCPNGKHQGLGQDLLIDGRLENPLVQLRQVYQVGDQIKEALERISLISKFQGRCDLCSG